LRDLAGKVQREYLTDSRGWSVGTDYFYRDGLLMAAETQAGRRHYDGAGKRQPVCRLEIGQWEKSRGDEVSASARADS
jgi:hypothetical protein